LNHVKREHPDIRTVLVLIGGDMADVSAAIIGWIGCRAERERADSQRHSDGITESGEPHNSPCRSSGIGLI
jgi:hypothetical protein